MKFFGGGVEERGCLLKGQELMVLINDCGCELRSLVDLCPFRHKKKLAAVQEKLKKVEVTKKVREESRLMGSELPPSFSLLSTSSHPSLPLPISLPLFFPSLSPSSHLSLPLFSCSFMFPPSFILHCFLLPFSLSPASSLLSPKGNSESQQLQAEMEELRRQEEEYKRKEEELAKKERVRNH